jgi:hypothetical protein
MYCSFNISNRAVVAQPTVQIKHRIVQNRAWQRSFNPTSTVIAVDVGLCLRSSHHHRTLFHHPLPPHNADTLPTVPLPFPEGCGPVLFSSREEWEGGTRREEGRWCVIMMYMNHDESRGSLPSYFLSTDRLYPHRQHPKHTHSRPVQIGSTTPKAGVRRRPVLNEGQCSTKASAHEGKISTKARARRRRHALDDESKSLTTTTRAQRRKQKMTRGDRRQ